MDKIRTTDDIVTQIEIEDKIDRLSKKIDTKRQKYEFIKDCFKKGFDPSTGKQIKSTYERERRIKEERDKFFDYKQKIISKMIDIEYEIDEKDVDIDKKTIISSSKSNNRKIKNRFLKNSDYIIAGTLIAALLIFGTAKYTTYKNHNDEIERKTEVYAEELDKVIDDATYTRNGNVISKNGQIVEVLDDDIPNTKSTTYIDYSQIADYIENSNNPDLAVFTLYKNYGTKKHVPEYNKIVRRTFKFLEYPGSYPSSDEDSIDNFDIYLLKNGYDTYNKYFKDTKKELYSDGDSELDNIKVKIKKMTP